MPTVKVQAMLTDGIGFYQPPKIGKHANPGRRIKDGQIFDLYYDDNYPLEDVIDNGKLIKKGQLSKSWMQLQKAPRKTKKRAQ